MQTESKMQLPMKQWVCLCAACRCGLNAILIEWFAAARGQPELQQLIATLLQVTGAYSISGQAMRTIATKRSPSHGVHERSVNSFKSLNICIQPQARPRQARVL